MGTISKLSEAHPYIYFYVDNPPGTIRSLGIVFKACSRYLQGLRFNAFVFHTQNILFVACVHFSLGIAFYDINFHNKSVHRLFKSVYVLGIITRNSTYLAPYRNRLNVWKQHRDLFMTFIDLTKASIDTISREGLFWKSGTEKAYSGKVELRIVWQLHDSMMVKVLDDRDESEAFQVTNGVKQARGSKAVFLPQYFSVWSFQPC